jgi:uncharacterized membrane protein
MAFGPLWIFAVEPLLHAFLAVVHALAGAAWFGAMVYSFFILHPRAHGYFRKPAQFEEFIATVSQGARWKVLSGLGIIAASGLGLLCLRWPASASLPWIVLMAAKAILFISAAVVFVDVSWRLWPTRVLALSDEVPHLQKAFRRRAAAMLLIAALSIALGVVAHVRS